ncbi:hypothetical protein CLU79DRAFT_842399 [Phycomyces nitens]|nr:hypothetical protein CLU79DRAFT_842399 [Phycomyces nitens]
MSVRKLLFLSVFIFLILAGCYAPPIDEQPPVESQQGRQTNMSKTYKIVRTIILGCLAHIMTIRPRSGTDQPKILFQRIIYLIYPTLGISYAVRAIISAWKDDEILRIYEYKKTFKELKRKKPIPIWSTAFAKYLWKTIKENWSQAATTIKNVFKPDIEIYDDKTKKIYEDAVADMENRYFEYCNKPKPRGKYIIDNDTNNSIYLAVILNALKPSKAKKIKHCILNDNLYLGFDLKNFTTDYDKSTNSMIKDDISLIKDKLLYTNNMSIFGPGTKCQYQVPIRADNVCFLTREMLDQLQMAPRLDSTSYTAICITSGQLVYTVIECINADGDKWVKLE